MSGRIRKNGFSLTEVMMAAGILAIGFMLIATVFPVGIKLTTTATERTIAAVAADEAFAKIRLYGVDFSSPNWPVDPNIECVDFANVVANVTDPCVFNGEFAYPSTNIGNEEKRYYWSALCRYNGDGSFQVTVFVSRKTAAGAKFPYPVDPCNPVIDYPKPVPVTFTFTSVGTGFVNEIQIPDNLKGYVTDDSVLVDTSTGLIMMVLERKDINVRLAKPVVEYDLGDVFWVVPPGDKFRVRSS